MIVAIYIVVILVLGCLSLTKKRIVVLLGFYWVYGFLKVMYQSSGPEWNQLALSQFLYVILLLSAIVRYLRDDSFHEQVIRWPLAQYFLLICVVLASALYSASSFPFSSDTTSNVWSRLTIVSIFLLAGSQIQQERDLKALFGTSAAVSVALSIWTIWNASRLNFEGLRGGIDVNQNFVSMFIFPGAIVLADMSLTERRLPRRCLALFLLVCVALGALILASRGIFGAFAAAILFMLARTLRGKGYKGLIGAIAILLVVFSVALLLPGGTGLLDRFQEERIGTLNDRTDIWLHAVRYFGQSGLARMCFGNGLSSASFVIAPAIPLYQNYHNEYLAWLMDQGVVGLIVFLVLLVSVAGSIAKSSEWSKNVMFGWLVFLAVSGLSSTVSDLHVFWLLLGVSVAGSSLHSRSSFLPLEPKLLGSKAGVLPQ